MPEAERIGRNTISLVVSQVFSQVSSAFYVAVLARYVLAEGMGKLAIAQAATGIAFVFVNLGLSTLIVRDVAQDHERTDSYLSGSIWLKAGLSVLACVGLAIFPKVAGYGQDLLPIFYFYAIGATLRSFTDSIVSIWQAHEFMTAVGGLRVLRDAVNVAGSLLAIGLGASLETIVGISVLANIVELAGALVIKPVQFRFQFRVDLALLGRLFSRNIPFAGLAIIGVLYAQAAVIVLSLSLDQRSVGFYSSAQILLNFLFIVPTMLSLALLPAMSRLNVVSKRGLDEAYSYAFRLTWVGGAFLAILTFFLAGQLVSIVFGDKYNSTIPLIQVMGLALFFVPGYVNGALLNATNHQKLFTISQAGFLVLQLALMLALMPSLGLMGAAVAYVLPSLIGIFYYTAIGHRLVGLRFPWILGARLALVTGLTASSIILADWFRVSWLISRCLVAPSTFLVSVWILHLIIPGEVFVVMRLLLPRRICEILFRILPSGWSSRTQFAGWPEETS